MTNQADDHDAMGTTPLHCPSIMRRVCTPHNQAVVVPINLGFSPQNAIICVNPVETLEDPCPEQLVATRARMEMDHPMVVVAVVEDTLRPKIKAVQR